MNRLIVATVGLASLCPAETAVQRLLEDKLLLARVKAIAEAASGPVGVATIDLTSGRVFTFNAEAEFPSASTIKVGIMAEMFAQARGGRLRLDDPVTVTPEQAVGGDGHLQDRLKSGPVTVTGRELMRAMIEESDNTATNRCISLVGMEAVNQVFTSRQMRATHLRRLMMDAAAAARNDDNTTSPLDMARLFEQLYRGNLGDPEATKEMLAVLRHVKADFRATVPAEIPVAAKVGDLTGVHCEAGIIELPGRPFVLSVYSAYLNDGENPVPKVAAAAFEYFRKLAAGNQYGNLGVH